jgi:hypothetical protein
MKEVCLVIQRNPNSKHVKVMRNHFQVRNVSKKKKENQIRKILIKGKLKHLQKRRNSFRNFKKIPKNRRKGYIKSRKIALRPCLDSKQECCAPHVIQIQSLLYIMKILHPIQ